MILAKDEKKKMMVPAGTYNAVCIGVWDVGIQKTNWGNKHNIIFQFELDCLIPEGEYKDKRFVRSKICALTLHEKASMAIMLESWIGHSFNEEDRKTGFDCEEMEGQSCMIAIIHKEKNGKINDFIGSVTKLPKGMAALIPENDNTPPKWVTEMIGRQIRNGEESQEMGDEDLPFN